MADLWETFDPALALYKDPVLEAYKKDIDWTLVESNLRMTHDERLQSLVNMAEFVNAVRPAVQAVFAESKR